MASLSADTSHQGRGYRELGASLTCLGGWWKWLSGSTDQSSVLGWVNCRTRLELTNDGLAVGTDGVS